MVGRVRAIEHGWLQAGRTGGRDRPIPIEARFGLGSMLVAVVHVVFPTLRLAQGLQTNRKSVGVATRRLPWRLGRLAGTVLRVVERRLSWPGRRTRRPETEVSTVPPSTRRHRLRVA